MLGSHGADHRRRGTDAVAMAAGGFCLVLFGVIGITFQYSNALGEWDLYSVLVGLLDGAASLRRLDSPLQYDREYGFGYILGMYALTDPGVLRDPDRLMGVMNDCGLWSMLAGLALFWIAVRLLHGGLAATIALILLAFSPMVLELATSGHPVQIAFAFLAAAAVLLFLPLHGAGAVVATLAALLLLTVGLSIRAEIFLAFPWLVLSRSDPSSPGRLIRSLVIRSAAPAGALALYFVLKYLLVVPEPESVSPTAGRYFSEFYRWENLVPGLVYMALGCGLATIAAGAGTGAWSAWRLARSARGRGGALLAALLGPLALIVVPFAFFLPNPVPPRHFLLTLAGIAILVGWAARHLPVAWALIAACLLVAANQVLAQAARPALLRANDAHSPYLPVDEAYRTTTHAHVGWNWQRHRALQARRLAWNAFGDRLLDSCDSHVLALSDEGLQVFSRLYAGGVPVQARRFRLGPFLGLAGVREGRHFIVLEKRNGLPADAVALVLADPALAEYRIVADPQTMTVYDLTPIPPDRAARLTCPRS